MKRTKSIDLTLMRKLGSPIRPKPLLVAMAAATLAGCSSREEVKIVSSVEDCQKVTEYTLEQCEIAYKKAVEEAARTGPRFTSQAECEADFGREQCSPHRTRNGSSVFMPAMAGFMVGQMMSRSYNPYQTYNPVFGYSGSNYTYRNRLMTADGSVVGRTGNKTATVSKNNLKQKPAATRTVSRGGFGSTAAAKSSWGSSSRSRGWGG